MEAARWCFQSRFPSLPDAEALPWGRSNGFGPPCHLWHTSISHTRRGSYLADGKQDVAEEKRGAHLQHMTVVRDMFQRYVKMTVMKETGGEGKEKKKSLLARIQGERFISVIRLNGSA